MRGDRAAGLVLVSAGSELADTGRPQSRGGAISTSGLATPSQSETKCSAGEVFGRSMLLSRYLSRHPGRPGGEAAAALTLVIRHLPLLYNCHSNAHEQLASGLQATAHCG